jgi:hypothetical protein
LRYELLPHIYNVMHDASGVTRRGVDAGDLLVVEIVDGVEVVPQITEL